ncbi:hypothetical protein T10_4194 [Trichinella papuae]|uniref:Uncharacterized protein n=1 Tax=Trichinella papuae TaxID=268474 RepID=A0A0V1MFB6_9BILA|nr:hypothetical protein T10_4194 [Trichinella papuae]
MYSSRGESGCEIIIASSSIDSSRVNDLQVLSNCTGQLGVPKRSRCLFSKPRVCSTSRTRRNMGVEILFRDDSRYVRGTDSYRDCSTLNRKTISLLLSTIQANLLCHQQSITLTSPFAIYSFRVTVADLDCFAHGKGEGGFNYQMTKVFFSL